MIWRAIATSIAKLHYGSGNTDAPSHQNKPNIWHRNTARSGGSVNNIKSNSSSLNKSSGKSTLSSRYRSRPTTIPIWQQILQRTAQSFWPPLSSTSIDDGTFCSFGLVSSHPTTQCSSIPLQLRATLIDKRKDNLRFIWRRPKWYLSNPYHGRSPPKYGSKLTMQRLGTASDMPPHQPRNHPPNKYVAKASATPLPLKK